MSEEKEPLKEPEKIEVEENQIKTIPIKTAATDKYLELKRNKTIFLISIIGILLVSVFTVANQWAGAIIAAIMCGLFATIVIKKDREMKRLKYEYDLNVK